MTAIKLDKFGGCLPAWDARLLPDGQASFARDTYLFSGNLTGWRQPKLLYTLKNAAAKFAFRIPNKDTDNTSITAADSFWMEFEDPDTNVIHTPVVDDKFQRYYYASPSQVPRYNTYDRILSGEHDWILGVPASNVPLGVKIEGGGDGFLLGYYNVKGTDTVAMDTRPGNEIFLVQIIPKDGDLLIDDVNFMPYSDDNFTSFCAVVYSDNNGFPWELLGVGETITGGIRANQTIGSNIQNPVQCLEGQPYWIGIAHDNAINIYKINDQPNGRSFYATFSNGPPEEVAPGQCSFGPTFRVWANLIGGSVFTARSYVFTWVTEYGEEGPPSEPVLVNGWSNAVYTLTIPQPAPADMGVDRNIKSVRLYRTISNQTGLATYFELVELPATQTVFAENASDKIVAYKSQLTSLYWFGPPAGLKGISAFPNGVTVGFKDNEVWFSEAYRPHAWPPGYVLTTEFPIVGIGVCGQAVVVCTQGTPYLITGINPAAMALTKINLPEPCMHRGSIVSTDTTVMYVSINGLIQVNQSGQGGNVTESWISRERWQELTPHKYVRAIKHATSYFAFGSRAGADASMAQDGFTVELSTQEQMSFSILPQVGGHRLGFAQLSSPNGYDIDNVLVDPWTGVGLLVQNDAVYYYDFTEQAPVIVPFKWRSKLYQAQSAKNLEAIKVWFTVPPGTAPQIDRNTNDPQAELGPNQYGIVRVYADEQLWCTRELRKSGELLRIYSGAKYETWSFEIEARVLIHNFQVATSVKELGLV